MWWNSLAVVEIVGVRGIVVVAVAVAGGKFCGGLNFVSGQVEEERVGENEPRFSSWFVL